MLDCSKLQLGRGRLDDTVSSFRRRLEQFRELTLPMLKVLDAEGRLSIVDGDTDSPSVQREFERVIRQNTSRLNHEVVYKTPLKPEQSPPKPIQKRLSQTLKSPSPPPPPKTTTIHRQPSQSSNQQQQQPPPPPQQQQQQQKPKTTQSNKADDAIVEDLDNMPGTVPTISNHISLIHSNTKSSIENDQMNNNSNSNNSNSSSNTVDINHVGNHVGNHVDEAKANPTKTFRSMLEEAESYPIDEA